ncbi:unnamed protein product [Effrenium voratum]|nr:unnamed protein product [Effrenium voratum]
MLKPWSGRSRLTPELRLMRVWDVPQAGPGGERKTCFGPIPTSPPGPPQPSKSCGSLAWATVWAFGGQVGKKGLRLRGRLRERQHKDRSLLQLLFQKGGEKDKPEEPEPVPVPGVARAGMPLSIPGMPPRTVDILLEIRARAAEKAEKLKGTAAKPPPKPTNEPPSHYEVLGIELRADETAIKKSYRRLVLQWHPDKHPTDREDAEVKIRQINLAYETISNPLKRQSYDQMLQALERRRLNIRLETQFIKPRMSIPKEFMLCPLGYSDKFVRIVDDQLLVQSRDEAIGVAFQEFFQAAKFSLWWLPEVNNMCRLRARESAGQGMEGGLNVSFQFQAGQGEDGGARSKRNEDPEVCQKKQKYVRRVYGALCVMLLLSFGTATPFMVSGEPICFVGCNLWLLWLVGAIAAVQLLISFVASLPCCAALRRCYPARTAPWNWFFISLLACSMGFLVGFFAAELGYRSVPAVFALATLIILGLEVLYAGVIMLVLVFISFFLDFAVIGDACACAGATVCGLVVVYRTQQMLANPSPTEDSQGPHEPQEPQEVQQDVYVLAAWEMYLDLWTCLKYAPRICNTAMKTEDWSLVLWGMTIASFSFKKGGVTSQVEASPFSQGAFWPGRYMAFRSALKPAEPQQNPVLTGRSPGRFEILQQDEVDQGTDVVDFVLVDFSAAPRLLWAGAKEVGAVFCQAFGERICCGHVMASGYVKLGDLRADLSVRLYFQQMLGSSVGPSDLRGARRPQVWNNKDFETFFEGHYEEWDYDAKLLGSGRLAPLALHIT